MKSAYTDLSHELQEILTRFFGHSHFENQSPLLHANEIEAFAKEIKNLGFVYFIHCSVSHYYSKEAKAYFHSLGYSNPSYQSTPLLTESERLENAQQQEEGFLITYAVRNIQSPSLTLEFRTKCLGSQAQSPSLSSVWLGADYQEREQYDLFGVRFNQHPNLQRIMLTENWQGHPLRKDYAIDTPQYPWRSAK